MKDLTGQQPEPKREDAPTILRHCLLKQDRIRTILRHCLLKQDRIRQSSDAYGNIEQRICSGLKDWSHGSFYYRRYNLCSRQLVALQERYWCIAPIAFRIKPMWTATRTLKAST